MIDHYAKHRKSELGALKRKFDEITDFTDDLADGNLMMVDPDSETVQGEPALIVNKGNWDAYTKGVMILKTLDEHFQKRSGLASVGSSSSKRK